MKNKELITHFAAANLFDAATMVVGVSSVEVHEILFMRNFLPWPESINGAFVLSLKCLITVYVLSLWALGKGRRVKWGGYVTQKAMQLTMVVVYFVSAWNLVQIGIEMIR